MLRARPGRLRAARASPVRAEPAPRREAQKLTSTPAESISTSDSPIEASPTPL